MDHVCLPDIGEVGFHARTWVFSTSGGARRHMGWKENLENVTSDEWKLLDVTMGTYVNVGS